jgi:hypothetical protein
MVIVLSLVDVAPGDLDVIPLAGLPPSQRTVSAAAEIRAKAKREMMMSLLQNLMQTILLPLVPVLDGGCILKLKVHLTNPKRKWNFLIICGMLWELLRCVERRLPGLPLVHPLLPTQTKPGSSSLHSEHLRHSLPIEEVYRNLVLLPACGPPKETRRPQGSMLI